MAQGNAKHDDNFKPTLIAVSTDDGVTPVRLEADPLTGALVVSATVSLDPTGLATDSNQTDGSQKTQIVDAGGEAVTVTGGKLDVNATAELAGETLPVSGASEGVAVAIVDGNGDQITSFGGGTQYTDGDADATPTGTVAMFDDAGTITAVSDTNPMPVSASIDTTGLATSAKQDTIIGHVDGIEGLLTTIDGDTGSIATSNAAIQTAVEGTLTVDGSGSTQPISHAALTELAAAIDTEVQVDVVGALPAGNNNIGDVDIASSVLPSGASTSANQTTIIGHLDGVEGLLTTIDADTSNLSVVGGGTEAAAIRVTLANNSTGVLSVDDNGSTLSIDDGGGAITVDGTVTAAAQPGVDIGDVTINNASIAVTQSGTWDEVGINDSGNSITVDATNLDVRDLSAASDSVTVHGDVGALDQLDLTNTNPIATAIVDGDGTQITSFGGGTQYTEGDEDASITGTAMMMEVAADIVEPVQGTVADGLLVNLGSNNDVTVSGVSTSAKQDTIIGHLDGVEGILTTIDGDTGNISTKIDTLAGAVSGNEVQVDVLSMPTTTVQATNLDIRDIDKASDDILVYANTAKDGSGTAYVPLVDTDGHLQVDVLSGGGAGVQYTEGDTDASITGTAMLWEDGSDTLRAVSATKPLPISNAGLDKLNGGTVELTAFQGGSWDVNQNSLNESDDDVRIYANTAKDGSGDAYIPLVDSSGHLQVDVLSAPSTAVTNAGLTALNGAISGSEVQVDVLSIAAGDNNIGNVDIVTLPGDVEADIDQIRDQIDLITPDIEEIRVDADAVRVATELIDDAIYVDDADWTADTSKHALVGGVTQVATTANTDGDVTPLTTNAMRELRTAIPESDLATAGTAHVKKYYTSTGAATDGIIWSPAAGKRWYVTDLIINVSAACTVTLEDDKAGGDETVMKFELAANSGITHSFNTPWFSGEDAADLLVTTSTGNIYITVTGYEV